MRALFHAGMALALCAGVSGCTTPGAPSGMSMSARLSGTGTILQQDVGNAVTIGRSTRADVMLAFGKTTAISFDSGFEVWVYRYAASGSAAGASAAAGVLARLGGMDPGNAATGDAEFVVLFAPTGIVTKTRVRPAPPPVAKAP